MNDVILTGQTNSIAVSGGNTVEIAQTLNSVIISDSTSVTVKETANTVSIADVALNVQIISTNIDVVSVGTQGPSGTATIGGKDLPTATPSDGDMIKFSSASDEFVYTQEIDAGTY
jgi:hypothetical protein